MSSFTQLSTAETAVSGYTHKLVVPYSDLTSLTSGTAYSVFPAFNQAINFAIGTTVMKVKLRLDTQFTFAAGNLSLVVGDGTSPSRFLGVSDLKAASGTNYNHANSTEYSYTAADTLDMVLTCSAGTPATISAGQFTLFFAVHSTVTE